MRRCRQDLRAVTPGSVLSCGDEAVAGECGEISIRARDWQWGFVFSETCLMEREEEIFLVRQLGLVGVSVTPD